MRLKYVRHVSGLSELEFYRQFKFYRFDPRVGFEEEPESFLLPPYGGNLPSVLALNSGLRGLASGVFEDFGCKLLVRLPEAMRLLGRLVSFLYPFHMGLPLILSGGLSS